PPCPAATGACPAPPGRCGSVRCEVFRPPDRLLPTAAPRCSCEYLHGRPKTSLPPGESAPGWSTAPERWLVRLRPAKCRICPTFSRGPTTPECLPPPTLDRRKWMRCIVPPVHRSA